MKRLSSVICGLSAIVALALLSSCRMPMAKNFTLHKNYGDHMVLQQSRPIVISGTAEPGCRVDVNFAGNVVMASTGANGEWQAVFPAMEGGYTPYTLKISGTEGVEPIVANDVLVGEVWFCSGQSNMEMPLWTDNPAWRNYDGDAISARGMDLPSIRLFNAAASRYTSSYRLEPEPVGEWLLPSAENLMPFSAVAYFFGVELQRRLNVPVGLISSCWGGTRIEPWIGEDAFRKDGGSHLARYIWMLDKLATPEKNLSLHEVKNLWLAEMSEQNKEAMEAAMKWANPECDTTGGEWLRIGNRAGDNVQVANTEHGFSWLVCDVQLPEAWASQELLLHFQFVDDVDVTYFNGVKVGATDFNTDTPNTAVRNYTIPAELARAGRNYIAVRVGNTNGIFGGIGQQRYIAKGEERIALDDGWRSRLEAIFDSSKSKYSNAPELETPNSCQFPSALYNSMVYPWGRYPVRGAIWYQGEANASEPEMYSRLFPLLAKCWRSTWGQDDAQSQSPMPIISCQLAGYGPGGNWPKFRQMQEHLLKVDDAFGMAVTMDKGMEKDIHPHDKKPVSERLAAEAMRLCYGSKLPSHGPYFREAEVKDDGLLLSFDGVGSGLASIDGKPLSEFEVAGADKVYFPATATVVGEQLLVKSDNVPQPLYVRYAWKAYSATMNFGNVDGFPASPFCSDTEKE